MQIAKDDHYCYCSDMLVDAVAHEALNVIATGENHMRWASSKKREVSPGVWVGTSYFTGKESIRLRFDVDHRNNVVDYMIAGPGKTDQALRLATWARVVPGDLLGYAKSTSVIALYQPRFADQPLDIFLRERFLHASEMYRIKSLAESGTATAPDALPTGEYLATASAVVCIAPDALFDFVSDGMEYGKWTWGRSTRTALDANTFLCRSDVGGPNLQVRLDHDRERKTVDYYVGETADAMRLQQSARIFAGSAFDYEVNTSLVTFTRWRAKGQSGFAWDRDTLSQIIETKMTKEVLENR